MSCLIDSGRGIGCRDSAPGLRRIFFVNFGDLEVVQDPTTEEVTAITPSAEAIDVYEYILPNQTGSFEEEIQNEVANGSVNYSQNLEIRLFRPRAEDRLQLRQIAIGRPHAIVETRNGEFLLVGWKEGLTLTGTLQTGTSGTDFAGYELTFTGEEQLSAPFVDPDAVLDNADVTIVSGT